MLGWILGAIAVEALCSAFNDSRSSRNKSSYYQDKCRNLEHENNYLRRENNYIKITFNNHMSLLADFDKVNCFAKTIGCNGAVDFFYYLAKNHDYRFEHFARFLNKVRRIRNDIAHNGTVYNINQGFLNKLSACVKVCKEFEKLPYGKTLCLS